MNKFKIRIFLITLLLFSVDFCYGIVRKDISYNAKIDSIYTLQKQIYKTVKNNPLKDKKYGVELNIFRILLISKLPSLSGGFSLFNVNRKAEISFPVYYCHFNSSRKYEEFDLDCHYRRFLGEVQNGMYLSGFGRFNYVSYYEDYGDFYNETKRKVKANRFGIGVGIGYRKFSDYGLFWGTSFSLGKYLGGTNYYDNMLGSKSGMVIDVEFLKFGWAF